MWMWKNARPEETGISPQEMTMTDPTNPNADWPDSDKERAQPGDILGIERGGETTSLGDTEEDEDSRRREAEEEAADDQE